MKFLLLRLLKFYKKSISSKLRPACRFIPTCSEYAYLAIDRYGALRGIILAAKRLIRCNPFAKGGYDPVPEDSLTIIRRN